MTTVGGGGSRVEVPGLSSGQQGPALGIEEESEENPVMMSSGERCADVPVLGSAAHQRASSVPAGSGGLDERKPCLGAEDGPPKTHSEGS